MGTIQVHATLPIELVNLIDNTRGEIPQSAAIRFILSYVCKSPDTMKSIIQSEYRNNNKTQGNHDTIRKYRSYDNIKDFT